MAEWANVNGNSKGWSIAIAVVSLFVTASVAGVTAALSVGFRVGDLRVEMAEMVSEANRDQRRIDEAQTMALTAVKDTLNALTIRLQGIELATEYGTRDRFYRSQMETWMLRTQNLNPEWRPAELPDQDLRRVPAP
jgi:myo-inositol catabolism protein IolC